VGLLSLLLEAGGGAGLALHNTRPPSSTSGRLDAQHGRREKKDSGTTQHQTRTYIYIYIYVIYIHICGMTQRSTDRV
jgi:hypothetical protein